MNERVLVVEDNAALAENIAELLRDEGLEVTVCVGSEDSQRTASEHGFDLAIIDIGLSGGDSGLDLAPRLKRHSVHGEIMLMTGNATLHSAMQAIRSGVYAYLPKPFDPEELVALSRRALAQVALKRERQALAQRLASSEALYRGVVETVQACIVGLDGEGNVRFANRFASDCFDIAASELVGASLPAICDARSSRSLLRAIGRAGGGETVRDVETRHEALGRTRTVRWTLTPLYTENLQLTMRMSETGEYAIQSNVLASGLDITERLELEQQHAEAQALGAMGTLTTSLAHEIRNPLNAAKLQLELMLRRAKRAHDEALQGQLEGPAKLVRTELERLSVLLDDFLNLARPRQPVRRPMLVTELLESVVTLKEPLAELGGVTLRVDVRDPSLMARADADKLKQVLLNLVRNGVDAIGERGYGEIVLSAERRPEGGVQFSVCDDGPGVAPEVIEELFKPFVTSKPAGTGLGLAIVRKIVTQHDGDVELLPRAEGGTLVRFFISE